MKKIEKSGWFNYDEYEGKPFCVWDNGTCAWSDGLDANFGNSLRWYREDGPSFIAADGTVQYRRWGSSASHADMKPLAERGLLGRQPNGDER